MTLYVEYCESGQSVNDFHLENELSYIKGFVCDEQKRHSNNADEHIYYSTENIFNRVRLAIVNGEIDPNDIRFVFEENVFSVNKYGAIPNWPKGFCEANIDMAEKIMRKALKIRKSD